MKTYSYTLIGTNALTSTDLREEADAYAGGDAQASTITIFDETGTRAHAERARALYLPGEGRLGVAWGADATWADVKDLESGIETWLNNKDAWERAN